ncbi:MAG: N-acetylmuramoyl-L-alanine amidase [Acidobacteriia bacterium]|nr:N-acetylmuramoyl-L-alanine amidase [Terriglobia bacterium]
MRHHPATIRPGLRIFFAFFVSLFLFSSIARADKFSALRETARAQFDRAEKDRQALEARPENGRSLKNYTSLVDSYRRVYLITPRATEVPRALNQVAELYHTMGDLFDEKYYQSAVDSYQFLLREYPTSRYREDAMLAIGKIEQDDLHDPVLAQKSYEEFLALHPRSAHAAEVRAILDMPNGASAAKSGPETPVVKDRSPAKTPLAEKTPATMDTKQESSRESIAAASSSPQVTRIRTWNADTYTRIVIDVGARLKYQVARISGPDRIYFDIENAKISPELLHKPIEVENGGFLKSVRIAQNQSGVVRVVLDVNHVKDYSVFLLPDPYRLVVDVYGSSAAAEEAARANIPAPGPTTDIPPMNPGKPAKEIVSKPSAKTREKTASKPAAIPPAKVEAAQNDGPMRTKKDSYSAGTAIAADVLPLVAHPVSSRNNSVRTKKSAHDQAEEMGPASTPEPTRDGQQSLTRALGLKIGRIVIDAGHGGHDTGTIGPTGLMEKDLCLDVALRVGRLIEQRLPGAEVIFTRDDDTFVPLEQRTAIANESRADLFLSIHANSSQDHKARGIETYYLNFTGSSDAMQVAARENALSENAVHDLQDIVKKIARNEKIEESRDFAGNIQDSLAKRMENLNRGDRNRGVRKAPFVVLIGANMPSVLAEISFISNPSDEQWLKKPENRQRVAEGLYHGIERYLQSTNSLTYNQSHSVPGNRAGMVARSGNPQ